MDTEGEVWMFRKCVFLAVTMVLILSSLACGGVPVEEEEVAPPSRIAFQSNRDRNYGICLMDADGSNQQRLTNNSAWDLASSWSP